jgi:hypothetical protein
MIIWFQELWYLNGYPFIDFLGNPIHFSFCFLNSKDCTIAVILYFLEKKEVHFLF